MKCNQKRIRDMEDQKIGERYDYGITVGIKLTALACHRRFGFGAARLEILDKEISKILDEIVQGASPHSENYRHNVERGLELLDEALQQIMKK